jgi:hypothetical protein
MDSEGRYFVKNVPAGAAQFSVQSPDPARGSLPASQFKRRKATGPLPPTGPAKVALDRRGWFPLPARYSTPASSGLSTTLKSGPNTFDIELK